jgi:hypothetical protein
LDIRHGCSDDDADVFEAEGSETLTELTPAEVRQILMMNPDCTMPAKRGKNVVSVNSRTGYLRHKPIGVRKLAETNRKRAKREQNKRIDLKKAADNTVKITSLFQPLLAFSETDTAESFDSKLDDALTDFGTASNARVDDMHQTSRVNEKDVLMRLWDFYKCQLLTNNVRGPTLANAYILFEQYRRDGDGTGQRSFSELKAGRTVAKTVFPRPKHIRTNASQNRHNRLYWYRHRARAIIIDYRYFVATGLLQKLERQDL